MGSRRITFLWLWPVTDHELHCWHVSINNIWRWTESTARSGWWRSHMAGIYSDCSTRQLIIIGAYSGKRLDWWSTCAMSMQCSGAYKCMEVTQDQRGMLTPSTDDQCIIYTRITEPHLYTGLYVASIYMPPDIRYSLPVLPLRHLLCISYTQGGTQKVHKFKSPCRCK